MRLINTTGATAKSHSKIGPIERTVASSRASRRLSGLAPRLSKISLAWLGEQSPRIPLIMPQPIKIIGEKVPTNATYGVTVIFNQRKSRPGKYVAICLTNTGAVDPGFAVPSCKIIRDWAPSRDEDLEGIDLTGFGHTDTAGDTLVTVQKVTCNVMSKSKSNKPRFVGLAQVVFDRLKMREELYPRPRETSKVPRGVLDGYGQEYSDED